MFNERITESDQVAIFREFYKEAVEKDTHLSAKEKSSFIANLTHLHSVLDTWSTMLQKQAFRPRWKDPVYDHDFPADPLPFGILTDDDIHNIIVSQWEAKRLGDPWCTPSFLYWYVSIPDKMRPRPPPDGYTAQHEDWVQTPFNGSKLDVNSKGHGEEIVVPWNLAAERVKPVALVKCVLANDQERQSDTFPRVEGLEDEFADKFLFTECSKYRKEKLNSQQRSDLQAGVEQGGPCGAYFTGADRGKDAKMTGGMDLIPTFVQDAERLQKEDWRPVMLNAWGLRHSAKVDGAADNDYNDFNKFSVGAMFHNVFDQKTGRACPGSTVMAAHGTHPVYLKQMLEVGLDREKFKQFSSKVPTFKSRKQFTTLGGGLYTTTQMSKASQYSPPVNEEWVRSGSKDVMDAWDFDAYQAKHDECWGAKYPNSMMRKSPFYLLIVELDVSNIFPLYAGTPDLQTPNVPMLEWALHYKKHQDIYIQGDQG